MGGYPPGMPNRGVKLIFGCTDEFNRGAIDAKVGRLTAQTGAEEMAVTPGGETRNLVRLAAPVVGTAGS
jgi:hypothetical protein